MLCILVERFWADRKWFWTLPYLHKVDEFVHDGLSGSWQRRRLRRSDTSSWQFRLPLRFCAPGASPQLQFRPALVLALLLLLLLLLLPPLDPLHPSCRRHCW